MANKYDGVDDRCFLAQWINPNGSRPHTSIAYDNSSNALFFTKDVTSYVAHTSSPVVEVVSPSRNFSYFDNLLK